MLLRVVVLHNTAIGNMGDMGKEYQTSLSAFWKGTRKNCLQENISCSGNSVCHENNPMSLV